MRLLKTAVLLLFFASHSQVCSSSDYSDTPLNGSKGAWAWSNNIARSFNENHTSLHVLFSREHRCNVAFFAIFSNVEIGSIAFNIDGKVFRAVTSKTALQYGNKFAEFPLSDSALRELKKGSLLRIETDGGTLVTSLSGSALSFDMAYRNCMKAIEKTTLKPSQITRPLPLTKSSNKDGISKLTTIPLVGMKEVQKRRDYDQSQLDSKFEDGEKLFKNGYPRISLEFYYESLAHAKSPKQQIEILEAIYKAARKSCRQNLATNAINKFLLIEPKNDWALQQLQNSNKTSGKQNLEDCLNDLQQGRKISPIEPYDEGDKQILELFDRLEILGNEDQVLEEEMTFYDVEECPESACERYILAIGTITDETPSKFQSFLKERPHSMVAFHSKGGDLAAGLELGLILRNASIDTQVGTYHGGYAPRLLLMNKENDDFFSLDSIISFKEDPVCLSACAYAFLGGSERLVSESASYGVHQFHSTEDDIDEEGTQRVVGLIGAYLIHLGINRDLLQLALWTGHEEMWKLNRSQLETMDVVTDKAPEGEWEINANKHGEIFVVVTGVNSFRTDEKCTFTIIQKGSTFVGILASHLGLGEVRQDIIEQCVDNLKSSSEEEDVSLEIGGDRFWFRYKYEFGPDGLQTIRFPLTRSFIKLLSYAEKINVVFFPFTSCKNFSVSLELPTLQQANSMKALLQ